MENDVFLTEQALFHTFAIILYYDTTVSNLCDLDMPKILQFNKKWKKYIYFVLKNKKIVKIMSMMPFLN